VRVSIIGTGYVGLVSGVCLAEKGHQVVCVDVDQEKVQRINAGDTPIYERGVDALLEKHAGRNLQATTDLHNAVDDTELSIIAVGTPSDGSHIDLSYVGTVAEQIGAALRNKSSYHVVVVKSTVVPGTTEEFVLPILERASGKAAGADFGVGMNPEFLKEGEAIEDFMEPDRIVLGGIDGRTLDAMSRLYASFPHVEKVLTTPRTAEMIKYTANSVLATLISLANEIGNLCAQIGVDVVEAMHGVYLDRRLSPILPDGTRVQPKFLSYLSAGCGFGGSCFPKDIRALISYGKAAGASMDLLESVIGINEAQPKRLVVMLKKHYPHLEGLCVAVLGAAFKPGTDDVRESPALTVVEDLLEERAIVTCYDPVARHEVVKLFGDRVRHCDTLETAIDGCDAILIMTQWPEFESLPDLLKDSSSPPLVIDGRRMLDKGSLVRYEGIGLPGSDVSTPLGTVADGGSASVG
jgi:UDPglucose 6-dehydrogenase